MANRKDKDQESIDELDKAGLNASRENKVDEVNRTTEKQKYSTRRYGETKDEAWLRRDRSAGASQSIVLMAFEKIEQLWQGYRNKQSDKAKRRWSKDESKVLIAEIIGRLSRRRDELGDRLPARKLWIEFWSELDQKGLHPKESSDGLQYDYDDGHMTFKKFSTRLSELSERKSR